MTNPATEAFERLFAELARKYDQTMDPGDLMQILSLINSRFSALELASQPSAEEPHCTVLHCILRGDHSQHVDRDGRIWPLNTAYPESQPSAAAEPERDTRLRPGERAWWEIGRDGETVTLFQKLEQAMEFGRQMERLAIENDKLYQELLASALGQPSAARDL